jgi:hypothetical protein
MLSWLVLGGGERLRNREVAGLFSYVVDCLEKVIEFAC